MFNVKRLQRNIHRLTNEEVVSTFIFVLVHGFKTPGQTRA